MEDFFNWLILRCNEKSTRTAFVGLLSILLSHIPSIPYDVAKELSGFLTALLITSAATNG
jgi:hypothetical protein